MAAGHLVAHSNLPLLGNINLCKLHYAVRKFITYCYSIFDSLQLCVILLICKQIVVYQLLDKSIGILVRSPLCRVDIFIVYRVQYLSCKGFALSKNLHTIKVCNTLALSLANKNHKLVKEELSERRCLLCKVLLCLLQLILDICLALLAAGLLAYSCKESLPDNCTGE